MTATVQASPAIPAISGGSLSSRRPLVLAGLAVGVAVLFLLALAVGSVAVPLDETLRVLVGAEPRDPRWTVVVGQIRLPRALTAALAGVGGSGGTFTAQVAGSGRFGVVIAGAPIVIAVLLRARASAAGVA
ncbi:hypothetical protein FRAHR75_510019 [Frankia sp. Hr75.2]|nr:hypothetical protein FRAHR75_510019 [Frankia sp. Hr75.2]